MNRSRFIRIFCMLIAILMLACSCDSLAGNGAGTENNSNATENTSEAVTSVTESSETTEATEESIPEDTKVTYVITVTDTDGNALAGATVQLCVGDMCLLPTVTDANGVATFELDEADYVAKVYLTGYTGEASYEFPTDSTELTVTLSAN